MHTVDCGTLRLIAAGRDTVDVGELVETLSLDAETFLPWADGWQLDVEAACAAINAAQQIRHDAKHGEV